MFSDCRCCLITAFVGDNKLILILSYSAELILPNKHEILGGGVCLNCYLRYQSSLGVPVGTVQMKLMRRCDVERQVVPDGGTRN